MKPRVAPRPATRASAPVSAQRAKEQPKKQGGRRVFSPTLKLHVKLVALFVRHRMPGASRRTSSAFGYCAACRRKSERLCSISRFSTGSMRMRLSLEDPARKQALQTRIARALARPVSG